jgi:hypothetical protein
MIHGSAAPDPHDVQWIAGEYPATETQVFTWVEGGFYGNLFTGSAAPPMPKLTCFSDIWTEGAAHMNDRICAGLGALCGMTTAGACTVAAQRQPLPTQRCATADGPECIGDGNYKGCLDQKGTLPAWQWPVTVWLNHPCDLSASFADPSCQIAAGP